jgi:antitoxin HicB
MDYPVILERDDNDTLLVSFPDFPEAHTYGIDREEALTHAQDALASAIDACIKDKREVPCPSTKAARDRVTVPALLEAKLALYNAMRAAGVGKAELARRLACHLPQVDRLLAMTHGSQLEQLEAAFQALGLRLVVGVREYAGPERPMDVADGGGAIGRRDVVENAVAECELERSVQRARDRRDPGGGHGQWERHPVSLRYSCANLPPRTGSRAVCWPCAIGAGVSPDDMRSRLYSLVRHPCSAGVWSVQPGDLRARGTLDTVGWPDFSVEDPAYIRLATGRLHRV